MGEALQQELLPGHPLSRGENPRGRIRDLPSPVCAEGNCGGSRTAVRLFYQSQGNHPQCVVAEAVPRVGGV